VTSGGIFNLSVFLNSNLLDLKNIALFKLQIVKHTKYIQNFREAKMLKELDGILKVSFSSNFKLGHHKNVSFSTYKMCNLLIFPCIRKNQKSEEFTESGFEICLFLKIQTWSTQKIQLF
jgi:hypothetical protein